MKEGSSRQRTGGSWLSATTDKGNGIYKKDNILKKEIKLFLKHIKKESQFRLVKINKIYSNCFLYVY